MKYKYIAFLIPLFIYACSGSNTESVENNLESNDSSAVNSKELTVYSVPSPAFVTSVLKETGNIYSDKLLNETRDFNGVFGVSSKKFMNLGVYIVDFNYAYNPYSSYNDNWDCPITPEENILPVAIKAGEKKLK